MSYILDALKKATNERQHLDGRLADLNARAVQTPWTQSTNAPAALPNPHSASVTRVATGALAFAALAVAGWYAVGTLGTLGTGGSRGVGDMGLMSTASTVSMASAKLTASAAAALAPPVATLPAPVSAATAAKIGPPTAVVMPVTPVMPAPLRPQPSRAPELATNVTPGAASSRLKSAAASSPAPMVPLAVSSSVRLQSLPPLPSSTPKMTVSGVTYSDHAAWRMLVVDGQVVREGDVTAQGLRLDTIGPKSAIVSYEGAQYRLRY